MKGEFWDLFNIEQNASGVSEVNIWAKSITDIKKSLRRDTTKIMWTDAWIARWDLLANEIYRNVYIWWVVPVVNDVMNVFIEPTAGTVIEAPHRYDIWEFLKFDGRR